MSIDEVVRLRTTGFINYAGDTSACSDFCKKCLIANFELALFQYWIVMLYCQQTELELLLTKKCYATSFKGSKGSNCQ